MSHSTHTVRYKKFRELLVQTRRDAGLTQIFVAKKLGKPQSYVSKYESGERRLDVIEFLDIAKVLNLDPSKVFKVLS